MTAKGFVIAAPSSGAGKTTVTLGLLRAYRRRGIDVRAAKSGPDYIDPAFHAVACGKPSINLDGWAMPRLDLQSRAMEQGGDLLVVEGAMGVLDAARNGQGSVADLAAHLGFPLVIVLDISRLGQSAVLPVAGLRTLRPDVTIAGVILNRAGSPRHVEMAEGPLREAGFEVLGAIGRDTAVSLPERHLGLVQAEETVGLDGYLDDLAARMEREIDLDRLMGMARPLPLYTAAHAKLAAPGQRIAVARDVAFAFAYPHMLSDWRAQGAEIIPFSPLADEAPDERADMVFLPGGYPELHAGRLASREGFIAGVRKAAARGARVYGECGGFMALGEGLIDADGERHRMCDLLPLTTSFAERRLTLGYRNLACGRDSPWKGRLKAHEFHYATTVETGEAEPLFMATDASGESVGPMGLARAKVGGSFAHVISGG
ncbi:cobyrinate a,c-diamide synthase [Amaricoccus tamworthensis]|uniref:cobyrinate a,c-diamide synthase n=1 Tax=Amaricoccus tamworthensis TaxID=57002 RepID=UPI003C79F9E2